MPELHTGARLCWLLFRGSALELWRNPLGLILLVVIPPVFIGMTLWTAGELVLPLEVYFGDETTPLMLAQRQVGLVFVSAAVSGFLAAYYALLLFHSDFGYFRFLAFMRMPAPLFALARFAAFLVVTGALAALTTLWLSWFADLRQPLMVFAGFMLMTVVYGAYGGIVGILSRSFMPALMLIVLLADLDAAWLQNPVYYSAAQQSAVIRWLPAHFPCQFVFAAAFTERVNVHALAAASAWALGGCALLALAVSVRLRGPLASIGLSGRFDQ